MIPLLAGCSAILLLLLGGLIGRPALRKTKPRLAIPGYRVVYSDSREARRKHGVTHSGLLRSCQYDLTGKPDYIYQSALGRALIVVELKSGAIGKNPAPYPGDLMQLAAYFLLVEEHYGVRPRQGRLIYKDYMFMVRNTGRLRRDVKRTLKAMRQMLVTGHSPVSPSYVACRYCMCRGTVCRWCGEYSDRT